MPKRQMCSKCGRRVKPVVVPAGALDITVAGVRFPLDEELAFCPKCGIYMLSDEDELRMLRRYVDKAKLLQQRQETPDDQASERPDTEAAAGG